MEEQIPTGLGFSKYGFRQDLISILMIPIPLISFNFSQIPKGIQIFCHDIFFWQLVSFDLVKSKIYLCSQLTYHPGQKMRMGYGF